MKTEKLSHTPSVEHVVAKIEAVGHTLLKDGEALPKLNAHVDGSSPDGQLYLEAGTVSANNVYN